MPYKKHLKCLLLIIITRNQIEKDTFLLLPLSLSSNSRSDHSWKLLAPNSRSSCLCFLRDGPSCLTRYLNISTNICVIFFHLVIYLHYSLIYYGGSSVFDLQKAASLFKMITSRSVAQPTLVYLVSLLLIAACF